ncbi:MAG TPA: hypothetical protein VFQ61_23060 [Polyangiaceae bacterium]|nr:hypothetical protein [Polyangiaceae bacterium]
MPRSLLLEAGPLRTSCDLTSADLEMPILNLVGRIPNQLALSALMAVSWACSVGCTELSDPGDHRELPAEEVDPEWGCLKIPAVKPTYAEVPAYIIYTAPIIDFAARPPQEVSGLVVEFCPIGGQQGCTRIPFREPLSVTVKLNGAPVKVPVYALPVPYGAIGYFRLTAPDYMPQEYYLGGPLIGAPGSVMVPFTLPDGTATTGAIMQAQPLTLVRTKDADDLAFKVMATRDPNQAIVAVRTVNCKYEPAAGVTITLERAANRPVPFTYRSSLALSSDPDAPEPTDENGLAGFANIAFPTGNPGYSVLLEGTAPTGEKYGKIAILVRPGQISTAEIRVSPEAFGR